MSNHKTYKDSLLDGEIFLEDIDNFIEVWNNSESTMDLPQWLGLSEYQYETWLKHGSDALMNTILNGFEGSIE